MTDEQKTIAELSARVEDLEEQLKEAKEELEQLNDARIDTNDRLKDIVYDINQIIRNNQ